MVPGMSGVTGLESLELEETTNEEIIKNVEKMIANEKKKDEQIGKDKNADAKGLDLNSLASQAGKAG